MLGLVIVNIGKPEIYTLTFPMRALRVKLQEKLPSRACALSSCRERAGCARSRPKANAVGTRKQAGCAGEARRTLYLHITRSDFGAEFSRPVGSCYRLGTADNLYRQQLEGESV